MSFFFFLITGFSDSFIHIHSLYPTFFFFPRKHFWDRIFLRLKQHQRVNPSHLQQRGKYPEAHYVWGNQRLLQSKQQGYKVVKVNSGLLTAAMVGQASGTCILNSQIAIIINSGDSTVILCWKSSNKNVDFET